MRITRAVIRNPHPIIINTFDFLKYYKKHTLNPKEFNNLLIASSSIYLMFIIFHHHCKIHHPVVKKSDNKHPYK